MLIYNDTNIYLKRFFSMNESENGFLITFEGVDGTGKTTQARLLEESNTKISLDINTIYTKQPFHPTIRTLLLHEILPLETQYHLFLADRKLHCQEVIKPLLDNKKIVICDRYIDSTMVYQGYDFAHKNWSNHKEILENTMKDNLNVIDNCFPDLTIYLKANYETILNHLKNRNEKLDIFEQDEAILKKRIESFELYYMCDLFNLNIDLKLPKRKILRIEIDNKHPEEISKIIQDYIYNGFNKERFESRKNGYLILAK
jgi:dTMP kinase